MILVGTYHHQIDENGRFRVPAKFKKALDLKDKKDKKAEDGEEKFSFILQGTNDCLFMYPADIAEKLFFGQFSEYGFTSEEDIAKMRDYTAESAWAEPDAQGRILISDDLLKSVGIEKDIVSVGVYNHVEIWSEKKWNEYLEKRKASKSAEQAKE